ncbi:LysR family transcriptional regulator [Clostridium sp. NSJ-6]|uniref:LysR family transcriptional regulator n=1 Tax=Clostridium hominis TaxID=2763036 RepID=A0ABR7D8L8_9CLOT|nr:LysR family transcriptional regulator [Clostridium hominis]MBC5627731.1 LysR family transcriptional regulator [Clostridium hominis]MDU2673011.1 LysR family transcriptional regulator [Clostridium sp.]MDY3360005.1 LysR family transcriptional regulator [Clostridium celatum]
MTLRHIKIFVAVCETGSATAAGEKLFIAQPSISLAISELEDYYGVKLFDRLSKRLYITEAGKHFLEYASHIVKIFEEMETEIRNFDTQGIIRIGASITIGNYLLPKYVEKFKRLHPNMEVQAIIANSDTIEENLMKNNIDLALIEGIIHSPYLKSIHFKEDELVLICGLSHPLAVRDEIELEDIKNEDLLLREKGSAGREICDGLFATNGIEINILWESTSTQAIVRAVISGLGLSILPYLLVKDSIERGEVKVIKIKDVSLKRSFSIIYHKNKFLTNSAKDFMDICK